MVEEMQNNSNHNAMNGVVKIIWLSFYPRTEGRGCERRFFDRTLNSPAIYSWENDHTPFIQLNGV